MMFWAFKKYLNPLDLSWNPLDLDWSLQVKIKNKKISLKQYKKLDLVEALFKGQNLEHLSGRFAVLCLGLASTPPSLFDACGLPVIACF